MVAGFPGTTSRHATAAEARFEFETLTPLQQRLLNDYSDRIQSAVAGDEAATINYASILKGADNYKKKYIGELAGADALGLVEPRSRTRRPRSAPGSRPIPRASSATAPRSRSSTG